MAIADRIEEMYEHVGDVYDTISNVYVNTGKQLFDKNNAITLDKVSFTQSNEYYYVNNSSTKKMLFVPINATSPCSFTVSKTSSSVFEITMFYAEPNTAKQNVIDGSGYLDASRVVDNSATSLTISSTFPGSTYKTLAIMYYSGDDTLTEQQILDSIMVNEGTTALPYEPYTDNPMYKNIENIPKVIQQSYLEIMNNGIDVIWDNWEKVVGEGTELTLNNTEQAPMKVLLKGNTYQDSTTGKNLFDNSNSIWTGKGKGIYDSADDTFTFHRDTGADYLIKNGSIQLKTNTGYTLYFNVISNTMTSNLVYVNSSSNLTGDNNTILVPTGQTGIFRKNLQTGNLGATYDLWLYCNSTGTLKAQIMIIEGVNDTSSYEPYTNGPAPNPDFPMPVHVVSGDNEVEVVGKNLLDSSLLTKSSNSKYFNNANNPQTLKAGTYTVLFENPNASYAWKRFVVINGTPTAFDSLSGSTISYSFTLAEESSVYIQCNSYIGADFVEMTDAEFNNIKNSIMLVKGTYTSPNFPSYKPYTSNTYPINLPVENLFDKTTMATRIDAYLTTPNAWNYSNSSYSFRIPCKPNTSYTISANNPDETIFRVAISDTESVPTSNNDITVSSLIRYDNTKNPITITTGEQAKYIIVQFSISQTDTSIQTLQVEEGKHANTFYPYGTTPIELCSIGDYQDRFFKTSGKNLYQGYYATRINQAITFTHNTNGDITASGTASGNAYSVALTDAQKFTLQTGTYTLSGGLTNAYLQICDSSGNVISTTSNNSTQTSFTLSSNTLVYLRVQVPSGTNINSGITLFPMLNEGSEALPYEPYGTGWYLEKKIGKVVLNGTETWSYNPTYTVGYKQIEDKITGKETIFSNYFKYFSGNWNEGPINIIAEGANDKWIFIRNDISTTLADFKTWLSTHNTEVYYVLATPTYTKIEGTLASQLEALNGAKSKEGQTNISQSNNDLPFVLDVSALSDGTPQVNSLSLGMLNLSNEPEATEEPEVEDETEIVQEEETPNEEPLEEVIEEEEK